MNALDERVRVVDHAPVNADLRLLRLHAPRIAARAQPGQFVQLRVSTGIAPLLRLPLSIAGADPGEERVELIYAPVGPKTQALAATRPGEEMACLGPLGVGFVAADPSGTAVLVGGGAGLPPLLFWGHSLRGRGIPTVLLAGARRADGHLPEAMLDAAADRCVLSTDDGSLGHAGRVTELLEVQLDSASHRMVYACGPLPMLRVVAATCRRREMPCQVSLEEYMGCGIGICMGCVVPVRTMVGASEYDRYQRVCTHGPVFDATAIDWGQR